MKPIPPTWTSPMMERVIRPIIEKVGFTDFQVLEIGCFCGYITKMWFEPWEKTNRTTRPPKVLALDYFRYAIFRRSGRDSVQRGGLIDWQKGDMEADFKYFMGDYMQHIDCVRCVYPENYSIDPERKFDLIYVDCELQFNRLRSVLEAVIPHCLPYRTKIFGPNYGSLHAPKLHYCVDQFALGLGVDVTVDSGIWQIGVKDVRYNRPRG